MVNKKQQEKPPTKEMIQYKNSRSMLVFGMVVVGIGIAQSVGFVHDFRQIIAHISGLPLEQWKVASQQITKSTYLSLGAVLILAGIIIMAIGRAADLGAAYKHYKGK